MKRNSRDRHERRDFESGYRNRGDSEFIEWYNKEDGEFMKGWNIQSVILAIISAGISMVIAGLLYEAVSIIVPYTSGSKANMAIKFGVTIMSFLAYAGAVFYSFKFSYEKLARTLKIKEAKDIFRQSK